MIPWWWYLVSLGVLLVVLGVAVVQLLAAIRRESRWKETADDMRAELDELQLNLKDFQKRAQEAERLAKVHLEANAAFEKQRDDAWKRYHAAGIGAGNAQAMLLRSLEGAVRELNKYRAAEDKPPVEVNPGLRDIVSEFKREHGTPA